MTDPTRKRTNLNYVIPPKHFALFGKSIFGKSQVYDHFSASDHELFLEHFGVTPHECTRLWFMMGKKNLLPEKGSPTQMLWCLLFFKQYSTMKVLSAICSTTRKTYKKWIRKFAKAFAQISSHVVSELMLKIFSKSK